MFTPEVMVIMYYVKNGSFFVFSADTYKKPVTVWAKYSGASERSHLAI